MLLASERNVAAFVVFRFVCSSISGGGWISKIRLQRLNFPVNVLQALLFPFAVLYGMVTRLRAALYRWGWKRSHRVGVPVIVVGNVTVGGTGKTPMALHLLAHLQGLGRKPGYLSRGYGRSSKGYLRVDPHAADGRPFGDEAFLIAHRMPGLPVAVCEDRVSGARRLIAEAGVDVLVLDDAFQHMRIARDLNLAMIDATRLPTRDWLLPMGRLREHLGALRRADRLILSKLGPQQDPHAVWDKSGLTRLDRPMTAYRMVQTRLQPFFPERDAVLPIAALAGQQAVAFSGLGNNAFFQAQLAEAGIQIAAFFPFADHHDFRAEELAKILEARHSLTEISGKFAAVPILTTEKDYFRLRAADLLAQVSEVPLYYVVVEMQPLLGEEALHGDIQYALKHHEGKN